MRTSPCPDPTPAEDILDEDPIFLTDLPHFLPRGRNGRPVHASTVLRWILRGVAGVRLEAVKIGGRWASSKAAVGRFVEHLTYPTAADRSGLAASRPSTTRAAEVDRALDQAGI